MGKIILFGQEARQRLFDGVEKLSLAVRQTLGPRGMNVIIRDAKTKSYPHVTKDGVTVARSIKLDNPIEDAGAQIVKQAAEKTVDIAGDGTTSSTIIAYEIMMRGLKITNEPGFKPQEMRLGITRAVESCKTYLRSKALKIENIDQIQNIAMTSSNGDVLASSLIAEAYEKVGFGGSVSVEKSGIPNSIVEIVDGMQFEQGYIHDVFITNADGRATIENPAIVLTEEPLRTIDEVLAVLKPFLSADGKKTEVPVVIIGGAEGEALSTLAINHQESKISVCVIDAPGYGDIKRGFLSDIAAYTGGKVIGPSFGLPYAKFTMNDAGMADKVVSQKNKTTILYGRGDETDILDRIKTLEGQLKDSVEEYHKGVLRARITGLKAQTAMILVGGNSDAEMGERFDRVEDALFAVQAAVKQGFLPGAGSALAAWSAEYLNEIALKLGKTDNEYGLVVPQAVRSIKSQLEDSMGILAPDEFNVGANGYTGATSNDLISDGIIDPLLVVEASVENGASVALMLLTTGCVNIEEK